MIDINIIRTQPARIRDVLAQKMVKVDLDRVITLDKELRLLQASLGEIRRQRNQAARRVAGKPSPKQVEAGRVIKKKTAILDRKVAETELELKQLLWQVPNIPSPDTPIGADASKNVVLRQVGDRPKFSFTPKPHWELGEALDIIDTEKAGKITGARFAYLKNELVQMQFALIQQALAILTDEKKIVAISQQLSDKVATKPFAPIIVPVMIRPEVMAQMGRLEPREERYHIESDDLYLVGSAEHTLGPIHSDEQIAERDLPRRYVGYSTSFRREAGSHGKDVRGILRLHQFDKLEIESFTTPEASEDEQNLIVAIQEYLMQSLGLPYQVVLKCTGDMGAPNYRAIDIETWLPGQGAYRETHTSDHMSDYQARRLRTKIKRPNGKTEYAHMNDATVFAFGRTLIAIMENYQQADGSIVVPNVLRPYLSFTEIKKPLSSTG